MTTPLPTRPKIHRLPALPKPTFAQRLEGMLPTRLARALASVLVVALLTLSWVESLHHAHTPVSVPAPDASLPFKDNGKTIVIQGENSSIVGQMAKIPVENEQITEIKPLSDIDKDRGHELLSIIGKY